VPDYPGAAARLDQLGPEEDRTKAAETTPLPGSPRGIDHPAEYLPTEPGAPSQVTESASRSDGSPAPPIGPTPGKVPRRPVSFPSRRLIVIVATIGLIVFIFSKCIGSSNFTVTFSNGPTPTVDPAAALKSTGSPK
jgi:hypothetical protein